MTVASKSICGIGLLASLLVALMPNALHADEPQLIDRFKGLALVACARTGLPPEGVAAIFGLPSASMMGRLDWRTNPDRYILLDYHQYGVWVEWEAGPIPRTGIGPAIRIIHGGINP
jgi:hypothetical protein